MNGEDDHEKAHDPRLGDRDPQSERGRAIDPRPEGPPCLPDKDDDGAPDRDDDGAPGEDRLVEYQVNGEGQRSRRRTLTVGEILQRAGASAGIDTTDLGNYYLERLRDDRRFDDIEDEVYIDDGDRLLAVYASRTPVA